VGKQKAPVTTVSTPLLRRDMNPFQVVKDFERAVGEYTGAPYCVTVNSCTAALLLALEWERRWFPDSIKLIIPSITYPSVPMSAKHAGWDVMFEDIDWMGAYPIEPTAVWDCAPRFTSKMYVNGQIQCVSFHAKKHLKIGQGGAILHDNPIADDWLRRARFDGRTEGIPTAEDTYTFVGHHCYMSPDDAARGLWLLSSYPKYVTDLPRDNYPNLKERWRM
jgi:dTDP-4-amino-4,6-dideoxygalactose transaminase